ncbi:MAG: APC family permease [Solirubrobacteraceae bacterium]|jgi:amino acid transporter
MAANEEQVTLQRNAISAISSMVIGVASTAPGFAIAVTLGFVVATAGMGPHAPAVMLVGFIPMFCIALAYRAMNRADPDCGTSFAWTTRAFGPTIGWVSGWAILMAEIVVNANQAEFAGVYGFQLFGLNALANNLVAVTVLGVLFIAVLTWICYLGIQPSARTQRLLLGLELFTLVLFSVVALIKVYTGNVAHSALPTIGWFNPFAVGFTPLLLGVLLAVFLYWGWDAGVSVNEETRDADTAPGSAAVGSTILLVGIVVLVTVAAQAFAGTHYLSLNDADVFGGSLGHSVLGPGLDKLLILALLSSSTAATQTTILPAARSALSMARHGAIPHKFAEIHHRHRTPAFATFVVGALSIVWFVFIVQVSTNVLADCITGTGFLICFYYGFTGFSSAWYYRRELRRSLRSFLTLGFAPALGGVLLLGVFIKSMLVYSNPANDVSKPLLGLGVPVWIGVGLLVLGFILALALRIPYPEFFRQRPLVAGAEPAGAGPSRVIEPLGVEA